MAAPSRRVLWIAVALAAVAAVLAYRHFELGRWLTLDQLKACLLYTSPSPRD